MTGAFDGEEGGSHCVGSSLIVCVAVHSSAVVVSEEDVDRSEGMSSGVTSEGALLVVNAKTVGIDAGVLHLFFWVGPPQGQDIVK